MNYYSGYLTISIGISDGSRKSPSGDAYYFKLINPHEESTFYFI